MWCNVTAIKKSRSKMVLDNHIDQDCFELFVRDQVYMEYAKRYLSPEQIDEVNINAYLTA